MNIFHSDDNPCDVPSPIKAWFKENFGDICEAHDKPYGARVHRESILLDLLDKLGVDLLAAIRIIRRRPIVGTLILPLAFLGVMTVGYYYWYTDDKGDKDEEGRA